MKRRLKCPKKNNKYYNNKPHGGLSDAVNGSPMISGLTVLDNCVGWANSRFNEIINDPNLEGIVKKFRYQLVCNAENFIESAKRQGLEISKKPVVGGIMVWQKGRTLSGSDGAGHVAVVEAVYDDGSILTSESGWASWTFKTVRRYNNNGLWGQNSAYKFRGCIKNPAVDGKPVPPPKLVVDGIGGMATVMAMQEYFGTPIDGIIGGQNKKLKKYYPALTSVEFGGGGSPCIKALQKWCGAEPDGILGEKTVKKWQKKLEVSPSGIFGKEGMKAWQRFLNDQLHGGDGKTPSEPKKQPYKGDIIDVSTFQDDINWSKVKNEGIVGAIVRCGYRGFEKGTLKEDDMFKKHIKGAHDAGLKVGVYFFTEAINAKEGKEEAAYTLNLVRKVGIPLTYPIAIDTEAISDSDERAKHLSKAKRTEAIKAFCEEIKKQGYEPMIYASTSWLENKLDMSKLPYKVWVAQYNDKVTYKGSYVLWQFTSRANISGVKGNCDVSKPYFKDEVPKDEVPKENKKSRKDLMRSWNKKTSNDNRLHYKKYNQKNEYTQTCPICDGTLDLYEHLPTTVYKKGSEGEAVKLIQKFLKNYEGAKIAVDGIYGDATEKAVKAFQKKQKIIYDGIWGATTAKKAKKVLEEYLGWNCVGAAAASWHHGMELPTTCNCHVVAQGKGNTLDLYDAKTDADALRLAREKFGIKDIKVIRSTKNIPKKEWKVGDFCCMFKGNEYTHAFIYDGDEKVFDATQSGGIGAKNNIALRNYQNYSCKVIIRYIGK